jgi:hypothetical protein
MLQKYEAGRTVNLPRKLTGEDISTVKKTNHHRRLDRCLSAVQAGISLVARIPWGFLPKPLYHSLPHFLVKSEFDGFL